MKDIDDTKAPLLDHLIELRKRLLRSLAVLVALFFASLYFAKTIFAFLVQPLIAAGQAVGLTSEATASLNPRPGVAYRAVQDAPPIPVWLAWWKDQPPQHLNDLVALACDAYRG